MVDPRLAGVVVVAVAEDKTTTDSENVVDGVVGNVFVVVEDFWGCCSCCHGRRNLADCSNPCQIQNPYFRVKKILDPLVHPGDDGCCCSLKGDRIVMNVVVRIRNYDHLSDRVSCLNNRIGQTFHLKK